MQLTNDLINEIRNKVDIVEIISNYIPLVQRGKNYFGVCPFHDDHSPSMSVSRDKQIYTCFSCGATGNVFTFVSEYEHISFSEAVKALGKKIGLNINTSDNNDKQKNIDYEIYELACKYYQNILNTSFGKNALVYLNDRKIDKDIIKKFRIGLSTKDSTLTDYLLGNNISLNKIVELGLCSESGHDLFSNRIMFPLYDLKGNVVAFSGRIYNVKDSSKYINTKETLIFKKGTLLYNYHNAHQILSKNDSIIVMEGFMDVIRASTIGINNCVATMGTAFTKDHALLLKKTCRDIILCFDGDSAGEDATLNSIKVLKEYDINPKVVRLEENLDPDEYILKYGEQKFKDKVFNPISSIDYMLNIHKNNKNFKDVLDVSKYIDEAINEIVLSDDLVYVELSLKKIALEFNISFDVIKDKYELLKKKKENKNNKIFDNIKLKKDKNKYSRYDIASRNLIYYMLNDNNLISIIEKRIVLFPDDDIRILVNEIYSFYYKYGVVNVADLISFLSGKDKQLQILNSILNMNIDTNYTNSEFEDYINVINSYLKEKKIKELNIKLKEENNPIIKADILSDIMKIKGVN